MLNRLRSLATTLIGFAFAAGGAFLMLAAEDPGELVLGAVCFLFFGAAGLVGLAQLMPARLPAADSAGRIVVRASRMRALIFVFAGLAFIVAGGLMALAGLTGGFTVMLAIGALGLPFGLAVALIMLRQAFRAEPLYILGPEGAESLTGIRWRLAWRDVARIGVGRAGANRWLMLETFAHVPDPEGWASGLNRRMRLPPYAITPGASGVDFDALAHCAQAFWEAHHPDTGPDHD